VLKRVEIETDRPMFGEGTKQVFYADSIDVLKNSLMLWGGGRLLRLLSKERVKSLRVGPKEHPSHYGCKVCPFEEPCRHLAAIREANNIEEEFSDSGSLSNKTCRVK